MKESMPQVGEIEQGRTTNFKTKQGNKYQIQMASESGEYKWEFADNKFEVL